MVYLMRTPERKKARLALEKAQTEAAQVPVDNKTTTTTNSETNVTKA
jgi:hypothetical protein